MSTDELMGSVPGMASRGDRPGPSRSAGFPSRTSIRHLSDQFGGQNMRAGSAPAGCGEYRRSNPTVDRNCGMCGSRRDDRSDGVFNGVHVTDAHASPITSHARVSSQLSFPARPASL
jgi:hypothetical protein